MVRTPWEVVALAHIGRDGMRIPIEGEAWRLPGGRHPCFRGRLSEIVYEWEHG